jgi:hypothetical protein
MNDLHYAVLVGINRYPGVADLRYARSDATAVREWLLAPDGGDLPEGNVKLVVADPKDEEGFTGAADAGPTRDDVNRALRAVNDDFNRALRVVSEHAAQPKSGVRAAWERSRLYLYVSGHGIAPDNGKAALLMANADEYQLGEYVELELYSNWYENCGVFRELIVFADCCRSRYKNVPLASGPPFTRCDRVPYGPTTKLIAYATTVGGDALEPRAPPDDLDQARGVFTQALLAGLRTAADPESGLVTAGRLARQVRQTVEQRTATQDPPQQVEILGDLSTEMVLCRMMSERQEWTATIHFPPGDSDEVVLRAGDLSEVGRRSAEQGSWPIDLDNGLYQVVHVDGSASRTYADGGYFRVSGADVDVRL